MKTNQFLYWKILLNLKLGKGFWEWKCWPIFIYLEKVKFSGCTPTGINTHTQVFLWQKWSWWDWGLKLIVLSICKNHLVLNNFQKEWRMILFFFINLPSCVNIFVFDSSNIWNWDNPKYLNFAILVVNKIFLPKR